MTQSSLPGNSLLQPANTTAKALDSEVIRVFTPIIIALIGGVLGLFALWKSPNNNAGFGLASTAIAGTAGLAQPQMAKKQEKE